MYKDHSNVITTVFKYFLCKLKENLRVSYCSIVMCLLIFLQICGKVEMCLTHTETHTRQYIPQLCVQVTEHL